MPSILTHYYFIKDTNKENIPFLENEEKVMYLGAQGVDPFYYYGNIINRFNKKEVNDYYSNIFIIFFMSVIILIFIIFAESYC